LLEIVVATCSDADTVLRSMRQAPSWISGARRRGRDRARETRTSSRPRELARLRDACSGCRAAGVLQADDTHLRSEMPTTPHACCDRRRASRVLDALVASNLEWTLVCTAEHLAGDAEGAADRQRERAPPGTFQVDDRSRSLRFCCARAVGRSVRRKPRRRSTERLDSEVQGVGREAKRALPAGRQAHVRARPAGRRWPSSRSVLEAPSGERALVIV